MGARNGREPSIGPDLDRAASEAAGARIAAGTLAAAGEVNRYYAHRLAEHRAISRPARDEEVHTDEHGEPS